MKNLLAIDQGTTSSRAILFGEDFTPKSAGQREFTQHFPKSGWVEHDAEEIWSSTLDSCKQALTGVDPKDLAAIGLTNQRETVVVWQKDTGKPVGKAIVWQDRRTADLCETLRREGHEEAVQSKTGLLLDPYFSSTKLAWILDRTESARQAAERGNLLFGTVDCFLIWRLTGGKVHATDATNAARTMLYNIHEGRWDPELLDLMKIPESMMPEVHDCSHEFGATDPGLFGGSIPIRGVAGDQQAATVGQACLAPGMLKSTYGTGCFALLNTGDSPVRSKNRLLTTIAYQIGGKPTYALEGSIFIAGAAVQWLRDGLGLVKHAGETQALAERADPEQRLYIVPAFTGLGAPHWDPNARGAIFGLTRNSGPAELAKAILESVAFQTRDLLEAMRSDWINPGATTLRVDGGMANSDWTMQALANCLGVEVDRPVVTETTALGAAYLAGMSSGLIDGPNDLESLWRLDRRFTPATSEASREELYSGWKDAVRRTLSA